jgi:hypothetical protein
VTASGSRAGPSPPRRLVDQYVQGREGVLDGIGQHGRAWRVIAISGGRTLARQMAMRRVLCEIDAVFPSFVRVTIPSWQPDEAVWVARRFLPKVVDAALLQRGSLYVNADIDAQTSERLLVSLVDWEWEPALRREA